MPEQVFSSELGKLKSRVLPCQLCPLHQSRNRAVFGNGNPQAPIMLVGEGPGADEDREGIAFIGKAGQLLDKILAACNFNRNEHVFISNIVKCRPPGNRKPEKSEMAACLPYLEEQIQLIDPAIIVTMGATALQGLTGGEPKITRERGRWQYYGERLLMPTFHPAALLRNPGYKKPAWEDFKAVVRKYRELVEPGHFCKYV
jgi:DNA polymerase